MKKTFYTLILVLIISAVHIYPKDKPGPEKKKEKFRLEAKFLYEYFEPDLYKPWKSLYFHLYAFPADTFNCFAHFGTVYRDGENDYIGIAGAARDWTDRFYTYTAVAKGTESTYMPEFRFDNDFNFKFGRKKELVLTLGFTYIDYYTVFEDIVISAGLTLYLPKWVIEYRLFKNRSNPGKMDSYTHLFSTGHGAEKKNWTYFTISYGSQAYLALYITTPEEIRQKALNVSLKHRRWLKHNFGFFIELNYINLKDAYDKYGIYGGLFLEF